MTIKVVFDDGTVLVEQVANIVATLKKHEDLQRVFAKEPGFLRTVIRLVPYEAGDVPKMRHYISYK